MFDFTFCFLSFGRSLYQGLCHPAFSGKLYHIGVPPAIGISKRKQLWKTGRQTKSNFENLFEVSSEGQILFHAIK
ncbi:hypothetical protein DW097_20935 [Enterocloster clostridioformis]|nr:hypothetical protein [Enterocloster bolteae]RGB83753.1 hypothetical protein DW097_20935 [Enterocloster clostridioformis]